MGKVIVYIDEANLTTNIGRLDYQRLHQYFHNLHKYQTVEIKIFVPVQTDKPMRKARFVDYLKRHGYTVITTNSTRVSRTEEIYKDDTDMQMTAVMAIDLLDIGNTDFVLVSGDRDFVFMLEQIIQAGRNVRVYGPARSTCWEYRDMQSFRTVESIYGVFAKPWSSYEQFTRQQQ